MKWATKNPQVSTLRIFSVPWLSKFKHSFQNYRKSTPVEIRISDPRSCGDNEAFRRFSFGEDEVECGKDEFSISIKKSAAKSDEQGGELGIRRKVDEAKIAKFKQKVDEEDSYVSCSTSTEPSWKNVKSGGHRKSIHLRRRRMNRNSKARAYSPWYETRTIEDLQDMKTNKNNKKAKDLESLAVVKYSIEPERDFRESMLEMIAEKKIGMADEFEELLACYLTLNSDECHDIIIKVFRQIWYNFNQ